MATVVDLNSDMGESWGAYTMGEDAAMLRIVTTANVACGFHGGDPLVMHDTVRMARENGVDVGAHPGFQDLWGFGRRQILGEPPEDVGKAVIYQLGALQAIAASLGHKVTHVKAHGSLGNMAAVDEALALALARAVKSVDPALIWVAMPYTAAERAGETAGLRVAREVFADRTYEDDATLTPRKRQGAVIHDAAEAAARVVRMVCDGEIVATSGKRIKVKADTVCVHGDNPAAVALAKRVRESLEAAGVAVRPLSQVVTG